MRKQFYRGVLVSAVSVALLAGCGGGEAPPPEGAAPAPTEGSAPAAETPTDQASPEAAGTEPVAEAAPTEEQAPHDYELRKRLVDATATQEEWTPELTANPISSTLETLKMADDALKAGKLEQGDQSALNLYLSVLANEPDNADAKAGVDKVVAELVKKGDEALTQSRFNEATRLAQIVTKLRPEDAAVMAFKAKVDSGREVGLLLGEAQRLAGAGKAVAPDGENAAAIYRGILRSDPNNEAAKLGLAKLESDLLAQANSAANAGNYAEADRLLADAGKVQPGSKAVQDASTRIVQLREGQADGLIKQADAAIAAKDYDRASQLLGEVEKVAAGARGVEELRARIDSARTYATLKPGQSLRDKLSSGANGPEMVVLAIGSFQMGSPDNEDDRKANEGPRHAVTLTKAIAMARTEITVGQFRVFVRSGYAPTANGSGKSTIYNEASGTMAEKSGVNWEKDHSGEPAADNLPVVHVSWTDAHAYAGWLAKETGLRYRLPSEAEFEYAARAGGQTRYPWGAGDPDRVVANVTGEKDRSKSLRNWVNAFEDYGDGYWGNAPVGTFEANRFGLHDLGGNVSEWVEDCWHDNYQRAPADGSAWVNEGCNRRVLRGASWASAPDQSRSAFRLFAPPTTTNARLGFRVVRDL